LRTLLWHYKLTVSHLLKLETYEPRLNNVYPYQAKNFCSVQKSMLLSFTSRIRAQLLERFEPKMRSS